MSALAICPRQEKISEAAMIARIRRVLARDATRLVVNRLYGRSTTLEASDRFWIVNGNNHVIDGFTDLDDMARSLGIAAVVDDGADTSCVPSGGAR